MLTLLSVRPTVATLLIMLLLTNVTAAWASDALRSNPSHSNAASTLRDAWLNENVLPPAPGYAFFLRAHDLNRQHQTARRLTAELDAIQSETTGHEITSHPSASGLHEWKMRLNAYDAADQSRSPGRADVAALVAKPRHNPRLDSLTHYGFCTPPDWVEVWHPNGVGRLRYSDGMTASDALNEVRQQNGQEAWPQRPDTAWQISPLGRVESLGIAAWNHQPLEITPGSRIVLPLPLHSPSARWVNRSLPGYLATRLPGDDCQLHSVTASPSVKSSYVP